VRLVRLQVEKFQCIESTEIDLGPGLNVLYGPNDHGKSSLASAIRAVLLLQHGSSHHDRFVSWYGGGPPRVVLTLCDLDGRYWRVTKSFGSGSAGHSRLDSSKDGRNFVKEAEGREVDDKLRGLLKWGLQKPGGGQGQRGFPTSFLSHVLLAEQDDVRKVLFDTSLDRDPDPSGRQRLTEALDALAEDPLFQTVLREAQSKQGEWFTATGRVKTGASSPRREVAKQITDLAQQQATLEQRVRDSDAAELRIKDLLEAREETTTRLEETRRALERCMSQLAARQEHDELVALLRQHRQTLQLASNLDRDLGAAQNKIELLHQEARDLERVMQDADKTVSNLAGRRDVTQLAVEAALKDDPEEEKTRRALEEQRKTAREELEEARRGADHAERDAQRARAFARDFANAIAARTSARPVAQAADDAAAAAEADLVTAQARHADAVQRARDLASGDRAQRLALARQELENQKLDLQLRWTGHTDRLARARAVEKAFAAVDQLRGDRAETARKLDEANTRATETLQRLARLDADVAMVVALQQYGALVSARAELARGRREALGVAEDRQAAHELRARAALLRSSVRSGLPSLQEIEQLRRHRDELRIAEAKLSLLVTVRPKRPLTLRVSHDCDDIAPRVIDEPATLEGTHSLTVGIDDLVDLEITSGAADSRKQAADLRRKWLDVGAPALRAHDVDTVEALVELQQQSEQMEREASEREREAEQLERTADARSASLDVLALERQVVDAEASLQGSDLEALGQSFESLGPTWIEALRRHRQALDTQRSEASTLLEAPRAQVSRLEGELDAKEREAARLEQNANAAQAELGEMPWRQVIEDCERELASTTQALTDLQRRLEQNAGDASTEAAAANKEVNELQRAVAAATRTRDAAREHATNARSGLVRAETLVDTVRANARDVDGQGIWTATFDGEATTLDTSWWLAEATRMAALSDQRLGETKRLDDPWATSPAGERSETASPNRRPEKRERYMRLRWPLGTHRSKRCAGLVMTSDASGTSCRSSG
jgi:hypothetical protein